jgi:hypothetical protein
MSIYREPKNSVYLLPPSATPQDMAPPARNQVQYLTHRLYADSSAVNIHPHVDSLARLVVLGQRSYVAAADQRAACRVHRKFAELDALFAFFAYAPVSELALGLEAYFRFYNHERLHQSFAYQTPAQIHYA